MFLLRFLRFGFVVFLASSFAAAEDDDDDDDDSLSMLNNDRRMIMIPCKIAKALRATCSSWQTPDHFTSQSVHHARGEVDPNWTTTQKLMPIIVGLVLTVFFVVLFLLYRRSKSPKQKKGNWTDGNVRGPRRLFGLLPDVRKVREANRANSWTIDQYNDYENIGTIGSSASRGSRSGHVRLSSSPLLPVTASPGKPLYSSNEPTWSVPGKEFWQNLQVVRKLQDVLPTPWKKKPIPVRSQPPRVGFRIDGLDVTALASLSGRSILDDNKNSWETRSVIAGASGDMNFRVGHGVFVGGSGKDEDESDSDSGLGESEIDEEQVLLIPPEPSLRDEENVVLISSSPGVDFSVESGDSRPAHGLEQAIRPSPSQSPQPSPRLLEAYVNLPPAPKYPAPLPPVLSKHFPTHLHKPSSESIRSYPHIPPPNVSPGESHRRTTPRSTEKPISTSNPPHVSRPSTRTLRRSPAHIRRSSAGNISPPSTPPVLRRPLEETGRILPPTHRPGHSVDNPATASSPYSPRLSVESLTRPGSRGHSRKHPSESSISSRTDLSMLHQDVAREIWSVATPPSGNMPPDRVYSTSTRLLQSPPVVAYSNTRAW